MVFGMTMIKVSSGQERSVYDHLQKRPEVRDVYRLFGEYSFFLVMQAEERNGLGRMLSEIKDKENVIKTGPVLLSAEDGGLKTGRTDFAAALG
ncbi:MAG: Lrp/AsnC ligand binding domain-containing protein [Methanothrix sp.]|jgi:DNA-binding Lrp family transcriptional regulator|nr:Lrp/AsnC ligand binding domain-containing protein [Methanothrix sp.]